MGERLKKRWGAYQLTSPEKEGLLREGAYINRGFTVTV